MADEAKAPAGGKAPAHDPLRRPSLVPGIDELGRVHPGPGKGTIKGGPGRPKGEYRHKATAEEQRQRVRMAMTFLCEGRPKVWIKASFKKLFDVSYRTVERYINRARKQIQREIDTNPAELVARSFGFYMSILADDAVSMRDKLRARLQADLLLGLQAPHKVARVTKSGDDVYKAVDQLSDAELEKLAGAADVMDRLKARAAGSLN